MAKYPTAVIPFSGLSPAACAALAAAIDDAIEAFRKWQLPTGPNTRLLNARRRLLKVANEGSYGTTAVELYDTAKAILVANDFYGISRTMQDERAAPIAEELRVALRGPLSEIETKNNTAFDIQSQFWFGTVLAYSGRASFQKARPLFFSRLATHLTEHYQPLCDFSGRPLTFYANAPFSAKHDQVEVWSETQARRSRRKSMRRCARCFVIICAS